MNYGQPPGGGGSSRVGVDYPHQHTRSDDMSDDGMSVESITSKFDSLERKDKGDYDIQQDAKRGWNGLCGGNSPNTHGCEHGTPSRAPRTSFERMIEDARCKSDDAARGKRTGFERMIQDTRCKSDDMYAQEALMRYRAKERASSAPTTNGFTAAGVPPGLPDMYVQDNNNGGGGTASPAQWMCSICLCASFDSLESAARHEKVCLETQRARRLRAVAAAAVSQAREAEVALARAELAEHQAAAVERAAAIENVKAVLQQQQPAQAAAMAQATAMAQAMAQAMQIPHHHQQAVVAGEAQMAYPMYAAAAARVQQMYAATGLGATPHNPSIYAAQPGAAVSPQAYVPMGMMPPAADPMIGSGVGVPTPMTGVSYSGSMPEAAPVSFAYGDAKKSSQDAHGNSRKSSQEGRGLPPEQLVMPAPPPPTKAKLKKSKTKSRPKPTLPKQQNKQSKSHEANIRASVPDSKAKAKPKPDKATSSTVPTSPSLPSPGVTPSFARLALPEDPDYLNERECFLRSECVEMFAATEADTVAARNGRRQPIRVGQVGMRCVFCSKVAEDNANFTEKPNATNKGQLSSRAVSYPSSIKFIRKALDNWRENHFNSCPYLPEEMRDKYRALGRMGSSNAELYRTEAAEKLGLVDCPEGGIRFDDSKEI